MYVAARYSNDRTMVCATHEDETGAWTDVWFDLGAKREIPAEIIIMANEDEAGNDAPKPALKPVLFDELFTGVPCSARTARHWSKQPDDVMNRIATKMAATGANPAAFAGDGDTLCHYMDGNVGAFADMLTLQEWHALFRPDFWSA